MGCLELFLSEVSSGVLAALEDGLALRPAPRLRYTFASAFHSCAMLLAGSHFLSVVREQESK